MGLSFDYSIQGLPALDALFQRWGTAATAALARGMRIEAEEIITDAKLLTPVLTGALRDSAGVLPVEIHSTEVVVIMGYGGAAAAYAVKQHEDLTLRHHVGGPKFLERAVLEHAAKGWPAVQAELIKALAAA